MRENLLDSVIKTMPHEILWNEKHFSAIVETCNDAIISIDSGGNIIFWNNYAETLFGYSSEQVLGKSILIIIPELFRKKHQKGLENIVLTEEEFISGKISEFIAIKKDGKEFPIKLSIGMWEIDEKIFFTAILRDITEQKLIEERLVHNNLYDSLTDLPNRFLFIDCLTNSVNRNKINENHLFAVLFLDLDRFKIINNSFGHMFGDKLLLQISNRLKTMIRSRDILSRFGGDEFIILIEDIRDTNYLKNFAERIKKELSEPFIIDEHEIFTTVSIGIALSSTGYINPEDLIRNANMAMYKAKSNGKSGYEFFNKYMHEEALKSLKLETDLWNALEMQEFRVYYQPIMNLATNTFVGFEGLVRWRHPEKGLLNPCDFIPNAEETGFILHIDNWVIREACSAIALWQTKLRLRFKLTINLNISGRNFSQPDFIEKISGILEDTGLDPTCLRLEISERVMMENNKIAGSIIQQLRDLKVQLQIDDFGTGYSSLSYLHRLPVNALKIDSSFVSMIENGNENTEIVKTIITLAHNLGIDVIAEGIETSLQLETLKKLKCRFGQGYYFNEALHPVKAKELLVTEQLKYIKL